MCVCVALWVCFITLSKQQRKGKNIAHRNMEKQGCEGRKQSRHVVSWLPSTVLTEAAKDSLLYSWDLVHLLCLPSFPLSLAVNSPCLHFSFFFHPNFLPTCQKSSELNAWYVHNTSADIPVHHKATPRVCNLTHFTQASFSVQTQWRGQQECRQIKAETDRYGNMPCRTCLFSADSLQEISAPAYLFRRENILHLL